MTSTASRLVALSGAIGATAAYTTYSRDMERARQRVTAGRHFIDSSQGPIEFAEAGDGPAVLFSHGAGGGFDQGIDLGRVFLGEGYRIVAPSRFGYLGTGVPEDASATAQAAAHLRLLDALELDRVPFIGLSAGAPSVMQLCLEHPERCSALILIVPAAYAPDRESVSAAPSRFFALVLNAIASSDLIFWIATKVARPALIKTILGTPVEVYRTASAADRETVHAMLRSIFPISRRFAGIRNDAAIASHLQRYQLEEIRIPTLLISAEDDLYGTYESSRYMATHIPHAQFAAFKEGGHMLLGHDEEVRGHVTTFLQKSLANPASAIAVA